MTAAAIATIATVEAATITSAFLSRRTRRKPSGGGFGHGWVWVAPRGDIRSYVEQVNTGLEEAAPTTACALQEISAH
jgi:hypothetical protein